MFYLVPVDGQLVLNPLILVGVFVCCNSSFFACVCVFFFFWGGGGGGRWGAVG